MTTNEKSQMRKPGKPRRTRKAHLQYLRELHGCCSLNYKAQYANELANQFTMYGDLAIRIVDYWIATRNPKPRPV